VEAYDPEARYFLVVDIKGVRSSDKREDRRGCEGEVSMRMLRDGDAPLESPEVGPVDPSLQARYGPPSFSGDGVAVGVVQGGYGSMSIVESLRGMDGLDVQPIGKLLADWIGKCAVLILPQPHAVDSFTAANVALLEGFVREGGGLIATHNVVGYRGFPPILTSVCAKGLAHVRDATWEVAREHAITEGMAADESYEHSYYDHIELEAGPDGVVVAEAGESGKPVVVAGEVGKGRYVACGLLPGVGRETDNEVAVTGTELALLTNAVRWCAGA
jgi:hypothetical protein